MVQQICDDILKNGNVTVVNEMSLTTLNMLYGIGKLTTLNHPSSVTQEEHIEAIKLLVGDDEPGEDS